MSLGKNIQKLRKENKLSQEQLGQKCNVSRQTISRWESDEVLPDTNNLITLAKLFNVSLDSIVFDDEHEKVEEKKIKKKKNPFLIILTIFLIISITINLGLVLKDSVKKNSLYGEWSYKENGYEVKLTLIDVKNKEFETYDDYRLYLFYKDQHRTDEFGFDGEFYKYIIQDDEWLGVRYKFRGEEADFYYNEVSDSIHLILNRRSLAGRQEFVLKKMK